MLENSKIEKTIISEKSISLLKDILLVLFFSFLTALSAELKVEIGAIPFTGQTLIVLLSGILLGKERGALSQITYLFGGIMGIPWFARGGGLAYILSPTFGYLLGFIPASYTAGFFVEKKSNILNTFISLLLSHLIIYSFGVLWLLRIISLKKALIVGLYPFLLGDSLKVLIIAIISKLKK